MSETQTTRRDEMKYAVEEQTISGTDALWHGLTQRRAIAAARHVARYTDGNIYISWYRASDGQHGYLNPDGNHAITGEAW